MQETTKIFLQQMFSNIEGFIEFRCIKKSTSEVKSAFFTIDDMEDISKFIDTYNGKFDIYVGVNPRPSKKIPKQSEIEYLSCLWLDIDKKQNDGDMKKILDNINSFPLEPTLLVNSGNGYHVYYKLNKPFYLANEEIENEFRTTIKALQFTMNGDSTSNFDRILRVPGTLNVKDPKNPKECTLEKINLTSKYDYLQIKEKIPTSNFDSNLMKKIVINTNEKVRFKDRDELLAFLGNNIHIIKAARKIPDKLAGDRSANDFMIACSLLEIGFNDSEVIRAFEIFAEEHWAAGEKFAERPKSYLLEHTLPKAKAKVKRDVADLIEEASKESIEGNKEELIENALKRILTDSNGIKREQELEKFWESLGGKSSNIKRRYFLKMIEEQKIKMELKGTFDFFNIPDKGAPKFIPSRLGKYLCEENNYLNLNKTLYKYSNGVFKEDVEEKYISQRIQDILGEEWKSTRRNETVTWVRDFSKVDKEDLNSNPNLLNLKNGMLDLETNKLSEHSPVYRSLNQLSAEYKPELNDPIVDKFMRDVFFEEDIPVVWEFAAYTMFGSNMNLKKFLVLIGETNNGKSVFLDVLTNVLGKENITSFPIQELANKQFAVGYLEDKLANIAADLPQEALKDTGKIKELTGGDNTVGEKKYQGPTTFKNPAKLIFSANRMPGLERFDEVFFRRMLIVECPNTFVKVTPKMTEEMILENGNKIADDSIVEKLSTESAKSTFLNRMIEAAKRLIENKSFSYSERVEKNILDYITEADSVTGFIKSTCEIKDGGAIAKTNLYDYYKVWCRENGRKSGVSKQEFKKRLERDPNKLEFRRLSVDGKQKECVVGIAYQDEEEVTKKLGVAEIVNNLFSRNL